ncbi:YibE/F-like protein [compost metagenome]
MKRLAWRFFWVFLLIGLGLSAPAQAHLPVQLFQGVESYESGVIRALPPDFDLGAFPRMPGGLFREPPVIKLEVELQSGAHRGTRVSIDHYVTGNLSSDVVPKPGERVIVAESRLSDGRMIYQIIDYDRRPTLVWMTLAALSVLLLFGRGMGLKLAIGLIAGGALLYGGVLPLALHGFPPLLLIGGVTLGMGFGAAMLALPKRSAERRAALAGVSLGLLTMVSSLALVYTTGHVSGLATPDALVVYSQLLGIQDLDYRQLWLCGALLTALGGLVAASVLTARAMLRCPSEDAWEVGLREGRTLLPALTLGTALLYVGFALPLLLISQLGWVSQVRISTVRFLNYDFLSSVILAWEAGLLGMVAGMLATAWAARRFRQHGGKTAP